MRQGGFIFYIFYVNLIFYVNQIKTANNVVGDLF